MPVLGTSATDSRSQRKDRAVDPTGRRTGSWEPDEGLTAAPSNDRTLNHSAASESPHVDSDLAPPDDQQPDGGQRQHPAAVVRSAPGRPAAARSAPAVRPPAGSPGSALRAHG